MRNPLTESDLVTIAELALQSLDAPDVLEDMDLSDSEAERLRGVLANFLEEKGHPLYSNVQCMHPTIVNGVCTFCWEVLQ